MQRLQAKLLGQEGNLGNVPVYIHSKILCFHYSECSDCSLLGYDVV